MGDLDVDYRNLSIPTDKSPEDYDYRYRRADILQNYLLDKGHPDAVNWSELSRYYSKSKSTLHNDKETLTQYLVQELDVGRISEISTSLFEAGLLELQADEDMGPFDYHSFVSRWIDTLDDLGVLDLESGEDPFGSARDGEGITVSISGVSADAMDDSELPEQDRPQEDDEEQEAVPA